MHLRPAGSPFQGADICSTVRQLNNTFTVWHKRFSACASAAFLHFADGVQLCLFVSAHVHQFFYSCRGGLHHLSEMWQWYAMCVFRCGASPDSAAPPQKQEVVWRQRAGLLHGPQRNAGHAALWPSCEFSAHVHVHVCTQALITQLFASENANTCSVRLQSAAAGRSCCLRKPWGLKWLFPRSDWLQPGTHQLPRHYWCLQRLNSVFTLDGVCKICRPQ